MRDGDLGTTGMRPSAPDREAATVARGRAPGTSPGDSASVIMTEISPFHCLYQDALDFHSQSRLMLARSAGASSRLARASLLLYVGAAESLLHQAAVELGRAEFLPIVADPARPIRLEDVARLLPAIAAEGPGTPGESSAAPWPQFAELLALRESWAYPGPASRRRAYYRAPRPGADYEPLQPHQAPADLGVSADDLLFPRTGLPRDPYALRPHHLDTARGILDAVVDALDRRLDGGLTRGNRHRREPVRIVYPPDR